VCAECGTQATGNFCSGCGADLRSGSGVIGTVSSAAVHSVPITFLRILGSPVKATVALAEDPTYRSHVSFLLTGIGIFCLLFVPILMNTSVEAANGALASESMQNLVKVLSQVGVYVGAVITFGLAYGLFRYFAKEPRTLKEYLKLYCLAFGFILPLYAVYEYASRGLLGVTGMSSFNESMLPAQWAEPSTLLAAALTLVLWGYFIAIHRRFWRMSVWRAGALYSVASITSYHLSYWLMYFVGYWTAAILVGAGVVTV
jgi:hypothetical protein